MIYFQGPLIAVIEELDPASRVTEFIEREEMQPQSSHPVRVSGSLAI